MKNLVGNARTSVLMDSREMESKDVPVPIGDYTYYESKMPTKLNLISPSIHTNLLLPLISITVILSLPCHESLPFVEAMLAKKIDTLLSRSSHTK